MAKQQSAMSKTIRAPQAASTIANLDQHTTSEAARAPRAAALRTGKNFTGQYLWNRFVEGDKTEVTKLDIVRSMVEALDVDQFKTVINEFVQIATNYRDNAIDAAKKAGTYNKDNPGHDIAGHLARLKTAQNHQSVMRVSYGALKFCPEEIKAFGYDETTGYLVMQVIARKALAAKGIKWDGTKADDEQTRERKAASKAETKALEKVMGNQPRNDGESMPHYLARCANMVQEQLARDNAEREAKMIDDLIRKVRKMAGGLLDDVIDGILHGKGTEGTDEEEPALDPKAAERASADAVKH